MGKKKSLNQAVCGTCAVLSMMLTQTVSADQKAMTKDIWQSCKGIKYVTKTSSNKNENCPDCGHGTEQTQVLPEVGLKDFYVQKDDVEKSKELMTLVAQKVLAINDANEKDLNHRASCFDGSNKDSDCAAVRKEAYDQITKYSPQLRVDLALAHSASDLAPDNPEVGSMPTSVKNSLLAKSWKLGKVKETDIDAALSGVGGLNNPFDGTRLSKAETQVALAKLKAEDKVIQKTMAKAEADSEDELKSVDTAVVTGGDPSLSAAATMGEATGLAAKRMNLQKAARNKYQSDFERIAYGTAKIFATLGAPQSVDENGVAHYSDSQIRDAYKKLAENAAKQKKITQASINDGTLEYKGLMKGHLNNIGARLAGDRDLLDYLAFKPVVEQVLKENPNYCGIATGLAMHDNYNQLQNGIALGGGLVAATLATGGLATAGVIGTGTAMAVGEGAGALALAMDVGYDVNAYHDYKDQTSAALADRGEGAQHLVDPANSAAQIKSARNNLFLQLGFSTLDIPTAAGVGKAMYRALENANPEAKAAAQALAKITDATPREEIALRNKALLQAVLGKDEDGVKSKLAGSLFEKFSKNGMTDQEAANLVDFSKQLLSKVDTKNEKQVAAARAIFKDAQNIDPTVFKEWSQTSLEGLQRMELKKLENMARMPAGQVDEIGASQAKSIEENDRVLEEMGVKDPTERKQTAGCLYVK